MVALVAAAHAVGARGLPDVAPPRPGAVVAFAVGIAAADVAVPPLVETLGGAAGGFVLVVLDGWGGIGRLGCCFDTGLGCCFGRSVGCILGSSFARPLGSSGCSFGVLFPWPWGCVGCLYWGCAGGWYWLRGGCVMAGAAMAMFLN